MKHALMVIGGWPGHTPEESADVSTTESEAIKVQSGTTGLEPEKNL